MIDAPHEDRDERLRVAEHLLLLDLDAQLVLVLVAARLARVCFAHFRRRRRRRLVGSLPPVLAVSCFHFTTTVLCVCE